MCLYVGALVCYSSVAGAVNFNLIDILYQIAQIGYNDVQKNTYVLRFWKQF